MDCKIVTAAMMEPNTQRWSRAMVGPLPNDFLRIATPREIQEAADRQAAMALYQQQSIPSYMPPNVVGRLSITVVQAKLVRNYGLTRMDPYVRVRIGHLTYETHTDTNGSKNPRWNRVMHMHLPAGLNKISVEIYDECSFKMDELIAWTEIKIPKSVFNGETHEEWYPLSGKQGEGLEGAISLVLSFSTQAAPTVMYQQVAPPVVMVPNVSGPPLPVYVAPQPPVIPQLKEEDLKQVQEMFPNIDIEVVKSIFEANRGDKDRTINSLLQINN